MKKILWFSLGFITLFVLIGQSASKDTTVSKENIITQQEVEQTNPILESVTSNQNSYESIPTQETTQTTYAQKTETSTPVVEQQAIPEPTPVPVVEERPIYTPPVYDEPTQTSCCKICSKGKACGDSCISRSYTCHKGPGCACDG